jgi:hypothetical protein
VSPRDSHFGSHSLNALESRGHPDFPTFQISSSGGHWLTPAPLVNFLSEVGTQPEATGDNFQQTENVTKTLNFSSLEVASTPEFR